jgi:DNA-binding transcriptional regulator YhcF (GntR family)
MDNVQTPSLKIDLSSEVPVVQQIAGGLRQALLAGALQPGDGLPSSRSLARDLGVHFNTVAQAYRLLESEGWLSLKRRAGTVVRRREAPELKVDEQERLAQRFGDELRDLCARYAALGLPRSTLGQVMTHLVNSKGPSS